MIANAFADPKCVREGEIGDGDKYDMESDDDEGSNAKIGYNATFYTVESLASI